MIRVLRGRTHLQRTELRRRAWRMPQHRMRLLRTDRP
jgi:hypothetical protein